MGKYFPATVKALRHRLLFEATQALDEENETKDFLRVELSKLLLELEAIARKEIQAANASGRNQLGLGDHPVYNLIWKFRRKVNV